MDSITQAVLGAAVGEFLLGKKAGYRAPVTGAVLGTLPDLDIIANPVLSNINELYFHRSITHSFLFVIAMAPISGYLLNKMFGRDGVRKLEWSLFTFWILLTHILIDLPTTYGTQVFRPFSSLPATTDSIFIIDPLFTLPLAASLLIAQFFRNRPVLRKYITASGLTIVLFYLIWGLGIKAHVHSHFDAQFKKELGYYEMIKTTPNGPTTFFWAGFALKNDTLLVSTYSIFRPDEQNVIHKIPRNTHLIEDHMDSPAVEAVLWFSRGYYKVEQTENSLVFHDLRFGRSDFWVTGNSDSEFVWTYHFIFDDKNNIIDFRQEEPSFNLDSNILNLYLERLL